VNSENKKGSVARELRWVKSGLNYSYFFQVVVAGHQVIHLYLFERNVHFKEKCGNPQETS
jgi:hypothetical protein